MTQTSVSRGKFLANTPVPDNLLAKIDHHSKNIQLLKRSISQILKAIDAKLANSAVERGHLGCNSDNFQTAINVIKTALSRFSVTTPDAK